jgi:hypothetical protein
VDIGPDGVMRLVEQPVPGLVRLTGWFNQYGWIVASGLILVGVWGWAWTVWPQLPASSRHGLGWLLVGLLLAVLIWMLVR